MDFSHYAGGLLLSPFFEVFFRVGDDIFRLPESPNCVKQQIAMHPFSNHLAIMASDVIWFST